MKIFLAVASKSGHWIEPLRLRKAFDGFYLYTVTDANIWNKQN